MNTSENYMLIRKPDQEFPLIDKTLIASEYPSIVGSIHKSLPWAAWLSDCEWNKEEKTLCLTSETLRKISISKYGVERIKSEKIMVIVSETTKKWYPFWLDPSLTTTKHVYFRPVDNICPIDYLLLERQQ